MTSIIRVFLRRNSYTPTDRLAFFGPPALFIPEHNEMHVSCAFSRDKTECKRLAHQWGGWTDVGVIAGKRVILHEPWMDEADKGEWGLV